MRLTVPLEAPEAADPERFGPKAANLARLAQAGLPTPGGTCIDAEAYRAQRLSRHQLSQLLGFDYWQTDEFLTRHEARRAGSVIKATRQGVSRKAAGRVVLEGLADDRRPFGVGLDPRRLAVDDPAVPERNLTDHFAARDHKAQGRGDFGRPTSRLLRFPPKADWPGALPVPVL